MKLFDCNWAAIAAAAPKWDALPLPCKALFVKHADPKQPLEIRRIHTDYQPLVQAGFLEPSPDQVYLPLPPGQQEFRQVVRAMSRHPVFQSGDEASKGLKSYLREHFFVEELFPLLGKLNHWGSGADELAAAVGQRAWLDGFLAETDFRRWIQAHRGRGTPPLLADAKTFDRAKTILRVLMEESPHVSFPELAEALGAKDLSDYGAALRALIGYVMVFPALIEPFWHMGIGIWPAIHSRLHRAAKPPPTCVTPARTFHVPFLADDMTMLLVACSAQPLRVRQNDGALFSKIQDDLAGHLTAFPEWLAAVLPITSNDRLRVAQTTLNAMSFTRVSRAKGKEPALEATSQGAKWLRGSDGERLQHILSALRMDLESKLDPYGSYDWDSGRRLHFTNHEPTVQSNGEPFDWRGDLVKAFAALPENGHVHLGKFLDFHATERNPFIRLQREGRSLTRIHDWHSGGVGEEELERLWRAVLDSFFVSRLLSLGCAGLGVTEDGKTTLGLAAPGRYLLGQVPTFDLGRPTTQDIVVQPNMEIVFLAHNPTAEATAARLAERAGHGVGVLFRITRRSVHAAFAAGWKMDAILEALGGLSRKPVPENVTSQVRDWAAQCRRVSVETAILLRCPDPATALRVLAAGGKKLERISDTVLALSDRKALRDIEKKLRHEGITRAILEDEESEDKQERAGGDLSY